MASEPVLRQATRALIIDERDRVLLVRFAFSHGPVWATPGGGIDDGESDHDALRRELLEEVGQGRAKSTRRSVRCCGSAPTCSRSRASTASASGSTSSGPPPPPRRPGSPANSWRRRA